MGHLPLLHTYSYTYVKKLSLKYGNFFLKHPTYNHNKGKPNFCERSNDVTELSSLCSFSMLGGYEIPEQIRLVWECVCNRCWGSKIKDISWTQRFYRYTTIGLQLLGRLLADLSTRRPGFHLRAVPVWYPLHGLTMTKVVLQPAKRAPLNTSRTKSLTHNEMRTRRSMW